MEKSSKVTYRHYAITELINSHAIENQQQLLTLLKDVYDIETNQSIISRDLMSLGILKQPYKNKIIYEMPDKSTSREILRLGVHSVVRNETLIIINTLRGLPPFIGDYLDQQKDLGILGTLAGENVVFVAPTSTKNITDVYDKVCQALFYKREEEQTPQVSPVKKTQKHTGPF